MGKQDFKRFIIFWLSQSVSQAGSAMTGFALVIWSYTQTGSAMAVSLMTFCTYLPYVLMSIVAGGFVDRHRKKKLMLAADLAAAVCSLAVAALWYMGRLEISYIYLVNIIIGSMNAIQSPAQAVAIGLLAPKDKMAQVSGMDSFSGNLITVVAPVLAAALVSFGGLGLVIAVDLASFLCAFTLLWLFVPIREEIKSSEPRPALEGFREGLDFLKKQPGLLDIMITMAILNFLSRLTYENILSPMILSRSGYNANVLGLVNAVMGLGGITGGLAVSFFRKRKNPIKMIYGYAGVSFLLGDLLMGAGQGAFAWAVAAVAASAPIPFIMAGQRRILYEFVPVKLQGRVFAVRNVFQYGTIPMGILLGGILADYVFEPFMEAGSNAAMVLGQIVGHGKGAGMAVMFLCTGFCGGIFCLAAYRKHGIRELKRYYDERN